MATVSVAHKGVAGAAVPNYFSYNISQFLDDVKGAFDDTFSHDVYSHFELTRRTSPFSNPLRYSLFTPASITDTAGKKRNVIRLSENQFMIEGDTRSKYQPSISEAI